MQTIILYFEDGSKQRLDNYTPDFQTRALFVADETNEDRVSWHEIFKVWCTNDKGGVPYFFSSFFRVWVEVPQFTRQQIAKQVSDSVVPVPCQA